MESQSVLTRCGDDLFTIAVDAPDEAQALALQLSAAGSWLEVIPGIDSVMVRFDAALVEGTVAAASISAVLEEGIKPLEPSDELIEIPVVYGGDYGPDLEGLGTATGLSPGEIINLQTSRAYKVDMIGFTPGFASCWRTIRRGVAPRSGACSRTRSRGSASRPGPSASPMVAPASMPLPARVAGP